ncbi:MAG: type II toxin-antitoxin system VapC family toxin [Burkholderiales bacterium]
MPYSVYIETSVVSYLTARASQDVVVAARQAITRDWWQETRSRFEACISVLVVEEAGAGDAGAAAQRAEAIAGLPILELNDAAQELAARLLETGVVPGTSVEDALHIALAAVHGMDFLLTWNFRHINNAETKARIVAAVESAGYECPVICSPEELGSEE